MVQLDWNGVDNLSLIPGVSPICVYSGVLVSGELGIEKVHKMDSISRMANLHSTSEANVSANAKRTFSKCSRIDSTRRLTDILSHVSRRGGSTSRDLRERGFERIRTFRMDIVDGNLQIESEGWEFFKTSCDELTSTSNFQHPPRRPCAWPHVTQNVGCTRKVLIQFQLCTSNKITK